MEFPKFPIGPVLLSYGGEQVEPDRYWYPYKCPFHDDSDASASVRTDNEGLFNCHSCGVGGNAVQVVMKADRKSYRDAVRCVEEITGVSGNQVRGSGGQRSSLPGKAGDWEGYSAFKRTWLRVESDDS